MVYEGGGDSAREFIVGEVEVDEVLRFPISGARWLLSVLKKTLQNLSLHVVYALSTLVSGVNSPKDCLRLEPSLDGSVSPNFVGMTEANGFEVGALDL